MMHNEDMRHQSHFDDDRKLDELIRSSLQGFVPDEEPSDRVWERIQASLDGGPVAFPEGKQQRPLDQKPPR